LAHLTLEIDFTIIVNKKRSQSVPEN